jgi:hypothetical protein
MSLEDFNKEHIWDAHKKQYSKIGESSRGDIENKIIDLIGSLDILKELKGNPIDCLILEDFDLSKKVRQHEDSWRILTLVDYLMQIGDKRGLKLLCKMFIDRIPGTAELGEAMEHALLRYGDSEAISLLDAASKNPKLKPYPYPREAIIARINKDRR